MVCVYPFEGQYQMLPTHLLDNVWYPKLELQVRSQGSRIDLVMAGDTSKFFLIILAQCQKKNPTQPNE